MKPDTLTGTIWMINNCKYCDTQAQVNAINNGFSLNSVPRFRVECPKCGNNSDWDKNKPEAIKIWNAQNSYRESLIIKMNAMRNCWNCANERATERKSATWSDCLSQKTEGGYVRCDNPMPCNGLKWKLNFIPQSVKSITQTNNI